LQFDLPWLAQAHQQAVARRVKRDLAAAAEVAEVRRAQGVTSRLHNRGSVIGRLGDAIELDFQM